MSGPDNRYLMQAEVAALLPIQEAWESAGLEEDRHKGDGIVTQTGAAFWKRLECFSKIQKTGNYYQNCE